MGDVVIFRSKHHSDRIAEGIIKRERINLLDEIEKIEEKERKNERGITTSSASGK